MERKQNRASRNEDFVEIVDRAAGNVERKSALEKHDKHAQRKERLRPHHPEEPQPKGRHKREA
ncbi:hypothetical protein GCM10009807_08090 [Microbacterium lacus]|uniref:DUF5302 domain-containing protein n=1 Tax=Microbacterium lacus TaxID=415217 RepID=A0ABP4SA99_9MICO